MEHDCRTHLAETCRTRDESPSSNLGRGKQRRNLSRHHESTSRRQRPALDVQSPQASQRTSAQSNHGVKWEHRAQTAQGGEDLDNNAKHTERWLQRRQFVQWVTECATPGQAELRMHDLRETDACTVWCFGVSKRNQKCTGTGAVSVAVCPD